MTTKKRLSFVRVHPPPIALPTPIIYALDTPPTTTITIVVVIEGNMANTWKQHQQITNLHLLIVIRVKDMKPLMNSLT